MEPQVIVAASDLENKLISILVQDSHLYLILGIFAVLVMLKYMKPTKKLFSSSYKWLIVPINLAMSCVGIFGFGLTDATTTGLKVVIMLVITAFTVLSYEALGKYVFKFAENRIASKNGNHTAS